MSVAGFHARFRHLLTELGATAEFHGRPNETPDPIPFVGDHAERPYDAEAVTRFFQASFAVDRILKQYRTAFLWPGGSGVGLSRLLLLCLPDPARLRADATGEPAAAYFDANLGEFLLPYDAVRHSKDPEAALMAFLGSTYRAAADLGGWDRSVLECAPGVPRRPRPM